MTSDIGLGTWNVLVTAHNGQGDGESQEFRVTLDRAGKTVDVGEIEVLWSAQ